MFESSWFCGADANAARTESVNDSSATVEWPLLAEPGRMQGARRSHVSGTHACVRLYCLVSKTIVLCRTLLSVHIHPTSVANTLVVHLVFRFSVVRDSMVEDVIHLHPEMGLHERKCHRRKQANQI